MTEPTQTAEEQSAPSELGLIARETVRLFKDQFGRGPVSSRAHWAGPDAVVCILEQTLTPAERKLVELGEHQAVREMRAVLEHATVPEFCALVEEITGRKVRGFTSAVDTVADGMAIEIWTLHPRGYEGPGRVQRGAEIGEIGPAGRRDRTNLTSGIGPVRPA